MQPEYSTYKVLDHHCNTSSHIPLLLTLQTCNVTDEAVPVLQVTKKKRNWKKCRRRVSHWLFDKWPTTVPRNIRSPHEQQAKEQSMQLKHSPSCRKTQDQLMQSGKKMESQPVPTLYSWPASRLKKSCNKRKEYKRLKKEKTQSLSSTLPLKTTPTCSSP